MKILVINSGSSSLKFQLIDTAHYDVLAKGLIERIGGEKAQLSFSAGREKLNNEQPVGNHNRAVEIVLTFLLDGAAGVVSCLEDIDAVGHRVVHGGEAFRQAVLIDDAVMAQIDAYSALAPLHNPANLAASRLGARVMPGVPRWRSLIPPFTTLSRPRLSLRPALRILPPPSGAALWVPRHVPSVCLPTGSGIFVPSIGQPEDHLLSSGQWRQHCPL